MSEESTTPDLEERFRRVNEDFNRGDFDAALATFRPHAVWDLSSVGLGIFEGREAIRGFWEDAFGAFEESEQVIEEFRDLGNGVDFTVLLRAGGLLAAAGSWNSATRAAE